MDEKMEKMENNAKNNSSSRKIEKKSKIMDEKR